MHIHNHKDVYIYDFVTEFARIFSRLLNFASLQTFYILSHFNFAFWTYHDLQFIGNILGSLSRDVFKRPRHSNVEFLNSSAIFEKILGQIVSIRVKTLSKTNLVAPRNNKREKRSLPVDVRLSKTSLLELRNKG